MSELRSAIEAFDVLVLAELPDGLIEDGFAEVRSARERLEVIELRFLAEADRRAIPARDGHLSSTSWLASVHKSSAGSAKAQVEAARALEQMPLTSEALGSGEISMSAAKILVDCRQTNPEAFGDAEPYLWKRHGSIPSRTFPGSLPIGVKGQSWNLTQIEAGKKPFSSKGGFVPP
jgi:Domain of unknown function (DUF222)